MDTKVIEVNQNFTVAGDLDVESSFTSYINIDFIPDVVIVRSILFSSGASGTEPGAFMISSNLFAQNKGIIGFFTENVINNSNISYILRRPINSNYGFQILDATRDLINISGSLFINLDFIKYKEVKEQKVY